MQRRTIPVLSGAVRVQAGEAMPQPLARQKPPKGYLGKGVFSPFGGFFTFPAQPA